MLPHLITSVTSTPCGLLYLINENLSERETQALEEEEGDKGRDRTLGSGKGIIERGIKVICIEAK